MDLVAPGTVLLVSTTVGPIPTNFPNCQPGLPPGYDCFRGTSAAAPHVAGVAALMMSEHNVLNGAINDLAPEDVEHIIENTATDDINGPLTYDEPNGWGRLNAGEAVHQVAPPYEVFHSHPVHPNFTAYPSETIQINNYAGTAWDMESGHYTAARTEVTFEYSDTFGPEYTVLNTWDRESSTLGVGSDVYIDGHYGASYTYEILPSTGTVNVTSTTNCWLITADAAGNPMHQWIPAPPEQLKTAYSIHLLGPGGEVAVGEQPAVAGFSAYPSPTSDRINVRLPATLQTNVTLDVLDITGRIVLHQSIGRGIETVQLKVENWAAGVYCLRLDPGDKLLTTRFVKR